MRVADFRAAHERSLLQVQVRPYYAAISQGMPVVTENIPLVGVEEHIGVCYDSNCPQVASPFWRFNPIVLLELESESGRAGKPGGLSVVQKQRVRAWSVMIAAGNVSYRVGYT